MPYSLHSVSLERRPQRAADTEDEEEHTHSCSSTANRSPGRPGSLPRVTVPGHMGYL